MPAELSRERILIALARINELLRDQGVRGEICLLGGTAMVLAFNSRASTKDVDGIFEPAALIREAASRAGEELGLPDHWLNDAAKGYVSSRHEVWQGDLPQFDHLRLTSPTAEYMLAMKCLAARLAGGPGEKGDEEDITFLIKHLHLESPTATLELVERYYPRDRIPARTQFLVEDIHSRSKEAP